MELSIFEQLSTDFRVIVRKERALRCPSVTGVVPKKEASNQLQAARMVLGKAILVTLGAELGGCIRGGDNFNFHSSLIVFLKLVAVFEMYQSPPSLSIRGLDGQVYGSHR